MTPVALLAAAVLCTWGFIGSTVRADRRAGWPTGWRGASLAWAVAAIGFAVAAMLLLTLAVFP